MKKLARKFNSVLLVFLLVFGSGVSHVLAEDIEIYDRVQTEPNVLFILDQSESMLQMVGSTGLTRDQIVKSAFTQVMSQPYQNLNVGFMDYSRNNGAGVDLPVADVNELAKNIEPNVASTTETYAEMLTRFVNNIGTPPTDPDPINPSYGTALVEALLEAGKYYRGDIINNLSQSIGTTPTWHDPSSQFQYSGSEWRPAGPRTLTTGGSSTGPGGYCKASGSPSGAPYSYCSNPWPGTCQNKSPSGPYTHTHGCLVPQVCTQYDATGTECINWFCPSPDTHSHSGNPYAYVRCQETTTSTGKFYNSPIQSTCTENYIVLLSDGAPTILGSHEQTSIHGFIGPGTTSCDDLSTFGFTDPSILQKGHCGPDLTRALSTLDIAPSITGTQTIDTYTVGFDLGAGSNEAKTYLQKLATDGNGQFFDANGAGGVSGLVTIFQNIFNAITQKPRTIARVGSSIDLSTLSASRDELYVPMFDVSPNQPRWAGNLKGYTMNPLGFLEGLDGNPAFDAAGNFNATSRSYWSLSADGGSVSAGGVANLLTPSIRNLKTDDGPGTSRSFQSLDSANTTLTGDPALFGLPGGTPVAVVQQLIDWGRGVDVDDEDADGSTTDPRNFIGDALHTDPLVANYDGSHTDSVLGNPIDRVSYFMTNEGYVHAINVTGNTSSDGGTELFAYMPSELLDNIDPLRRDVGGDPKVYGLDGPLTLFQVGGPTNVAGQKYLYFGMRRGGMNYYALNVTDPNNPTLMWVIEGGSGNFKELGQTWSEPVVTNVTYNGASKLALVIGGGYDTNQDSAATYSADNVGRAVYVVDAVTGAKLWSAGPISSPDSHDLDLALSNGIAGDVSVIDFDNDTVADRLYFGDIGGHVWRIDLHGDLKTGTPGPANDYSGYLLADLHGSLTIDNRRFFARPVAALTPNGKLAVSIGSGHRSHPLDPAVQDRFYTIYDPNINSVPSSAPSVIDDNDLQNITNFTTGYTDTSKTGWRIDLGVGEKVFNFAQVLRGEIFFSTYIPPTSICNNSPNGARLFVVDLEGKKTRDLDGDITNGNEEFVSTFTFGIIPEMTLHYGSTGMVRGIFLPNIGNIYSSGLLEDKFWTNTP